MYKYNENRFTESLLNLGILRVGTLYDFRKSEHKNGIADPTEGKKTVNHHIEDLHIPDSSDSKYKESSDARALEAFRAIKIEGATNITIQNSSLSQVFDVPDCFIFCTSKIKSKKVMQQFEGADSCLHITDTRAFYSHLTDVINAIVPVRFKGIHEIIYQDRHEKWNEFDWGHHPAVIKEREFSDQYEIRAIWEPKYKMPIQPLILANYKLCSTFKKVLEGI